MTATLKRNEAGDYIVEDGSRAVRIQKGLGRDWHVSPMRGIDFKAHECESYGAAKRYADAKLRQSAAKHATFAQGPAPKVNRGDVLPAPGAVDALPSMTDGDMAAALRGMAVLLERRREPSTN